MFWCVSILPTIWCIKLISILKSRQLRVLNIKNIYTEGKVVFQNQFQRLLHFDWGGKTQLQSYYYDFNYKFSILDPRSSILEPLHTLLLLSSWLSSTMLCLAALAATLIYGYQFASRCVVWSGHGRTEESAFSWNYFSWRRFNRDSNSAALRCFHFCSFRINWYFCHQNSICCFMLDKIMQRYILAPCFEKGFTKKNQKKSWDFPTHI